ncbi:hypothetical protein HDZ31DRAFT_34599 [Schizophyllum fasciatum]
MHHCLAIPEILTLICETLSPYTDVGKRENRPDLVRLARTCKSISQVALRCLWKTCPDLAVMVKYTMPSSLWTGRELTPARPIAQKDLKRFYFYAPFVREINFGQATPSARCTLSDEGYIALCLALKRGPIFPNLTCMGLNMNGVNPLSIRHFISPALTRLRIIADALTTADIASLQYVQQQCPKVAVLDLKINGPALDTKRVAIISDVLCGWTLKELTTTHISWRALGRLASSKTLQRLHLVLGPKSEFNGVSIQSNAFSHLGYLCIDTVPISFGTCVSMFRQSAFYSLHTLIINTLTPNPALWEKLTPALRAAHKDPPILRHLTLKETRDRAATATAAIQEANAESTLHSLYCFSGLEELHISSSREFLLTPVTLQCMGKFWPEMRDMGFSVRYRFTPKLPLHALEHLAAGCRHLKTLRLDVSAVGVSLGQAPPPSFERQRALTSLAIDWSAITSARVVATYLSTLFANIKTVSSKLENSTVRTQGDVRNRKWKKVEHLLPAFTAMREHVEHRRNGLLTDEMDDSDGGQRKELNDTEFASDSE